MAGIGAGRDVLERDDLVDAVDGVAVSVEALGDEEVVAAGCYSCGVGFIKLLDEAGEEGGSAAGCEVDWCRDGG